MDPTFVVSTGRCGSTMLSHILHGHPDVLSVSEFLAVTRAAARSPLTPEIPLTGSELWALLSGHVPELDALVTAGLKPPEMCYPYGKGRFAPAVGVPLICHDLLPTLTDDPDALFDRLARDVPRWPRRPAADQYRAFFTHLARLLGRRVVVERSAASLLQIPQLRRLFPGARFVHMYRDGPDCALSMSRHPTFRREMLLLHAMKTARAAGLDTPSPRRIEDAMPERFRGLLVPPYDAPRFRAYPLPVAAFARGYWTAMVRVGVPALTEVPPDRRTHLRYEDLLTDPDRELTRLAAFLAVPAPPGWLASARRLVDPTRRGTAESQLPTEEYEAVRTACAPGAEALAAAAEPTSRPERLGPATRAD